MAIACINRFPIYLCIRFGKVVLEVEEEFQKTFPKIILFFLKMYCGLKKLLYICSRFRVEQRSKKG